MRRETGGESEEHSCSSSAGTARLISKCLHDNSPTCTAEGLSL
uniref:Uncharacterized protein n=1 Tax=Anguilla anguilla TaxID=7936 RepID=A0A0E9PVE0_ANGAN